MAEDNNARYRPADRLGRGSAPAGQTNDPLAELARLIGRNDPFSDVGRELAATPRPDHIAQDQTGSEDAGPNHAPPPSPSREPPPHFGSEIAARHSSDPLSRFGSGSTPHYDTDQAPRGGDDYPPRFADEQPPPFANDQPPRLDWPRAPEPARSFTRDPFVLPSQPLRMPAAPAYETQAYSDPHGQPATDNYEPDRRPSDPPAFASPPDHPAFLQALYPQEPAASSMPPPRDEEFYDDAPRSNRRRGLLTVAAVLALAVVGTAGAFGYRTMFGGAGPSAPPPVIRASAEPSKVAPPTQPVDQTASKFSYDRFSDRGQNEQVVVREEKPVDNREFGRSSVARTALPDATAGVGQPPATTQANANPPSALGEPRRVRTVPIRPDQPDSAAMPQPSARQQAAPMRVAPPPPPARQPSTVAEAPTDVNSSVNARAASPRSNQRVASRTTSAVGAGENAPLSLSPDSNNLPPPAMAAREAPPPREVPPPREAPPPRAAAPTRAAAPPVGNGGGYVVQVSSQKSEADAQSSYRSIQSKYSSVLNGQRHSIRRADLGSRGIYYRAMVGPFDSREAAVQLCGSLKAAGGDCIVQAN
jgi:SPOR domain